MKSRAEILSSAAFRAVVAEALTSPKPGLVDIYGNGCHGDMNCALFLESALAIRPFFERQANVGLRGVPPERAAAELKETGIEMERAMTAATKGVNTHKGFIYLISLLLYGAGASFSLGGKFGAGNAARLAASAAKGTVSRELETLSGKPRGALTNGERLFLEYGVTGARGEAESAFPSVVKHGLPTLNAALDKGASLNDAGIAALLSVMLVCCDSNVIHRGGYDYWRGAYMELVAKAKSAFNPVKPDYGIIFSLEEAFSQKRVSPGGAADLLGCAYFLYYAGLFENGGAR